MPRPRDTVKKRRNLAKRMREIKSNRKRASAVPEGPSQSGEPQPSRSRQQEFQDDTPSDMFQQQKEIYSIAPEQVDLMIKVEHPTRVYSDLQEESVNTEEEFVCKEESMFVDEYRGVIVSDTHANIEEEQSTRYPSVTCSSLTDSLCKNKADCVECSLKKKGDLKNSEEISVVKLEDPRLPSNPWSSNQFSEKESGVTVGLPTKPIHEVYLNVADEVSTGQLDHANSSEVRNNAKRKKSELIEENENLRKQLCQKDIQIKALTEEKRYLESQYAKLFESYKNLVKKRNYNHI